MGPTRYGRQRIRQPGSTGQCPPCPTCSGRSMGSTIARSQARSANRACGYRIKPHGQLVPVSLTHYCASTPGLSTRWSSATLQGGPPLCALCADICARACFPGVLCRISPIKNRLGRQASEARARLRALALGALSPLAGFSARSGDKHPKHAHATAHKGGLQGSLISRRVSRLDAFSGYLFRT